MASAMISINFQMRNKYRQYFSFIPSLRNTWFLLGMLSLLASCRKDTSFEIPDPGYPGGLDSNWYAELHAGMPVASLRTDLGKAKNILPYDYNGYVDVYPEPGLRIQTIQGSLNLPDGTPATGPIEIEWACPETIGDVIEMNAAASSGDAERVLGIFYVVFRKNNLILVPSDNFRMHIEYVPMTYYYGNPRLYAGTENFPAAMNWTAIRDNVNDVISNSQYSGIRVSTNKTGWLMVAQSDPYASNTCRLATSMQSYFTNANSIACLIYKNQNTVISLKADLPHRRFQADELSGNTSGLLLVISKMESRYYMDTATVIIPGSCQGDIVAPMNPVITSLPQIRALLESL